MLLALTLLACGGSPEDPGCREGFSPAPDGHCYPSLEVVGDSPTFADAFEHLPECQPGSTDGKLHLASACASGVCVGGTVDEAIEALGLQPTCWNIGQTTLYCQWIRGIEVRVADDNGDGWPDPEAPITRIRVFNDYTGGTEDGLGVPVGVRCFIDALGLPDRAVLVDVAGTLYPSELSWDRYGVHAYDFGSMGSGYPSGVIDNLYLYGAE